MKTVELTNEQKDLLINKYSSYQVDNDNEYIIFAAKINNIYLSIFENKNHLFKCTISGNNEDDFLNENNLIAKIKKQKINEELQGFLNESNQIGSDEVGFGDLFGPIVVVATYVDQDVLNLIKKFNINDSKKVNDETIINIVPQIINKVDYSILCVDNEKLSELINQKHLNLNQIKSILHNTALNNVYKKHKDVTNVFIDKFNEKEKYFEYIKDQENNINDITFEIHGEQKYPSIAISSWIARYYFLKKIEEISKKYSVQIPLGASKKVDEFAKDFKNKFGLDELNKIIKTNFKNYKDLL